MTDKNINVCVACDDNYSKYAGVVITSVLANALEDNNLCFYILDGGISEEHKEQILSLKSIKDCEINFVKIDESMFEDYMQVKTHSYITLATFYRLKLPTLLPNIDRVIYFDCDIVVNTSLKDLFNVEMGSCPVAGVSDINKKMVKSNPTYVNAGMLVMDLKNMREQNVEKAFLDWTIENLTTITVGDQEIINEVLKNNIKVLDQKWHVQVSDFANRSIYVKTPRIIHYIGKKKPWNYYSLAYHKEFYFRYLQMTPWKMDKKEFFKFRVVGEFASVFRYILHRPLLAFQPKFYCALFCTCLNLFRKDN